MNARIRLGQEILPDLLAAVTCGDTPNNGLEEVEDVPQRHRVEDPTSLPKTTFAMCQTKPIGSNPTTFGQIQNQANS